jgi:Kef-type K+ transport system membrane component KefB
MQVPVAAVLGDVALVLAVSALFGAGSRRLGQPAVIGQILAGIALGPTLPGYLTGRLRLVKIPAGPATAAGTPRPAAPAAQ